MSYKSSASLLTGEVIDLKAEMALITPTDTPLTTLLMGRGQVVPATDLTVTWREKSLSETRAALKLEGAEAGDAEVSTRALKSNLCQILEKVTAVSGTMSALNPKGIGNAFDREISDRLVELKRDIEYYFINGTKAVESGTTPRQMDGLINLVAAANKTATTGAISEDKVLDGFQKMYDAGAQGNYYLFVNATEKRFLNKLLSGSTIAQQAVAPGDNALGILVNRVETDFGVVNIVLNRQLPAKTILGLDLTLVEIAELRSAFYEALSKTGDFEKGHVLAENTIKLLNTKGGYVWSGVEAPDYVEPSGG